MIGHPANYNPKNPDYIHTYKRLSLDRIRGRPSGPTALREADGIDGKNKISQMFIWRDSIIDALLGEIFYQWCPAALTEHSTFIPLTFIKPEEFNDGKSIAAVRRTHPSLVLNGNNKTAQLGCLYWKHCWSSNVWNREILL